MKTLVISYLPRRDRSNTKKLQDYAIKKLKGDVEILDLTKELPIFFLEDNLSAYYKRNYGHQELNELEKKTLEQMDRFTEQIKNADNIILSYPMYNFSMPGIVKTYFDNILQKGDTWDMGDKGYVGLLKEKNALVITTSGGVFQGDSEEKNHNSGFVRNLFQFMGFKNIEIVNAEGLNMFPDKATGILDQAKSDIDKKINVFV